MLFEIGHNRGYLSRKQRGPYAINRSVLHLQIGLASPAALGIYMADVNMWNAVFELYLQDDLAGAATIAGPLGAGPQAEYEPFLAALEAESLAGENAEIVTLHDNLELEFNPTALSLGREDVMAAVERGWKRALEGFACPEVPRVLVSILLPDTLLPFVGMQAGYLVPKTPYGKICLPHDLSKDAATLEDAVAHEAAYYLTYLTTQRTAEAWVYEAATVLATPEGGGPTAIVAKPEDVNRQLYTEDIDDDSLEQLLKARNEAIAVGRRILADYGRARFLQFLNRHEPGVLSGFTNPRGLETDNACHKVFHMSEEDLFWHFLSGSKA